ncbi:hypothetical protein ACWGB8_33985 [Kitasatospora sp. NPDC054939]
MSTNRSRRIDRDTAEHLLGGAVVGTPAGPDAHLAADARPSGGADGSAHEGLARVLAAASAPAAEDELTGEEAAVAAFRAARLAPAPLTTAPVRRRSMATAVLTRASTALSAKAAAAVLTATALGGVAVAAGTGNLPTALGGGSDEPRRSAVPGAVDESSADRGTTGAATGGRRPTGGTSPAAPGFGPSTEAPASGGPDTGSATAVPGRSADPALTTLCRAFADRTARGEHPPKPAGEPQYGPLVDAAGGPERVEAYCGAVLGRASDDNRPGTAPQPSSSDKQGRPDGKPTDGKPADRKPTDPKPGDTDRPDPTAGTGGRATAGGEPAATGPPDPRPKADKSPGVKPAEDGRSPDPSPQR